MQNPIRTLIPCAMVMALLAGANAQSTEATTASKATSLEVSVYRQLYPSSVLQGIRFDQQADPEEAVREEIYLVRELTRRAEKTPVAQDKALQADIEYYQGVEILNGWLRSRLKEDAVTTSEIEAYYREHQDEFTKPELVTFHHLFLLVPRSNAAVEKEKKEQADKILAQLRRGADFERLITEYSDIKGAKQNKGKVGPVDVLRLNSAVQAGLKDLQPGEVSEPLRTPYGWELLQLDERTSPGVATLDEVGERIREQLFVKLANEVKDVATGKLKDKYAVKINDELLSATDTLTTDAVVLTVGNRTMTVGELLRAIHATYAYGNIKDPRERIRAALPRMILTEEVRQDARASGVMDSPVMKLKMAFVRDRLLSEQYFKRHRTGRKPTLEDLKKEYETSENLFVTPPEAKGIIYRWNLPTADLSATAPKAKVEYDREVLKQRVEKLAADAREGRISRDELAAKADESQELDWFREGPMGYRHDKAFFGAEPGQFTEIFPTRKGLSMGWVAAKKKSERIPFEECKDRVERRLLNKWSDEEAKAMVDEVLRQYALHQ